jgi:hypothetical protein
MKGKFEESTQGEAECGGSNSMSVSTSELVVWKQA